jgi:hypothetical protein
MTHRTAAQAIADATSALTQDYDVADAVAHLVRDCADVLGADAIGVMLLSEGGDLELLSSTSHSAAELELFGLQQRSGPCADVVRSGELVSARGGAEIEQRWGELGRVIVNAGFDSVHAFPLRWHSKTVGAMNVFRSSPADSTDDLRAELDDDALLVGQVFADLATVFVVQSSDQTEQHVTTQVRLALQSRAVVEQAKGVLSYQQHLDMSAAYDLLVARAARFRPNARDDVATVMSSAQVTGTSQARALATSWTSSLRSSRS